MYPTQPPFRKSYLAAQIEFIVAHWAFFTPRKERKQ